MWNYTGMKCAKSTGTVDFCWPEKVYITEIYSITVQYYSIWFVSVNGDQIINSADENKIIVISTMQHHQIQAITWSDVIQRNATQPSLQCVSVLSRCDSFRTNSVWCSNVNKMSDQPVWWGLWVVIDKAAAEESGTVSAPRDGDTKWTQHFGRPCRQRWLQLCLNSYILYEFVIEKSHYAHQRHIGTNISLPNIVHNTRDIT